MRYLLGALCLWALLAGAAFGVVVGSGVTLQPTAWQAAVLVLAVFATAWGLARAERAPQPPPG